MKRTEVLDTSIPVGLFTLKFANCSSCKVDQVAGSNNTAVVIVVPTTNRAAVVSSTS